jgi:hypothetical protein
MILSSIDLAFTTAGTLKYSRGDQCPNNEISFEIIFDFHD